MEPPRTTDVKENDFELSYSGVFNDDEQLELTGEYKLHQQNSGKAKNGCIHDHEGINLRETRCISGGNHIEGLEDADYTGNQ